MKTTYFPITVFAVFGAVMLVPQVAVAGSFAHWAKLNPNTRIGQMGLAMRSKVKHLPSEKELGLPVYPGAKIYMYTPAGAMHGAMWNEKKKGRSLPAFYLASKSPSAKIVNFYVSHLQRGYKRIDIKLTKNISYIVFVKAFGVDVDAANATDSELGMTYMYHPYVMITPATSTLPKVMPNTKTTIYVSYRPKHHKHQRVRR